MAITTDTTRPGTLPGMMKGMTGSTTGAPDTLIYVRSDPDGLTPALGSQIAQDVLADELYMCETDGNTDWIHLISGA